jgi:RecG-like helicase
MGVLHVKPAAAASNTLAGRLARLGLKTDADFALHLPLRYEDETRITALADARPGVAAQFEVEVTDCDDRLPSSPPVDRAGCAMPAVHCHYAS